MDGCIVRYAFKDFMVHSFSESFPHRQLNIISGGNGTGKSSLFNGILFCLNGKTSFVNRAKKISDFIKHGKTECTLELELLNKKGKNHVITRTIHGESSNWMINKNKVTLKDVQSLIEKLNIQVDNLCQFLPQDRVADFAKMNKFELLENVEKAIDYKMYQNHQKLKTLNSDIQTMEILSKDARKQLENELSKNQRLEQEVQNFESKRKFIKQIDMMKHKITWMEYSRIRETYLKKQKTVEKNAKKLRQLKVSFDRESKVYHEAAKTIQHTSDSFNNQVGKLKFLGQSIEDKRKECETLYKTQANSIVEDFEMKRNNAELSENVVKQLKEELKTLDLEAKHEKESFEAVQPQYKTLLGQRKTISTNYNDTKMEQEAAIKAIHSTKVEYENFKRESQFAQTRFTQQVDNLKHKYSDVYRAHHWLTQNQHLFKRKIIGPLCLYVKTKTLEGLTYLENQVGENEWKGFLCFDQEDFVLFLRKIRKEMHLKIPIFLEKFIHLPKEAPGQLRMYYGETMEGIDMKYTHYINQTYTNIFSPTSANGICNFSKLFDTHLKDFIHSCPFEIADFLCRKHRVHEVPIALPITTRQSSNNIENNS